ncbi:MAG TPA: carboxypeptidase-like regulatory domain-containing protein [Terriglobia bacterium]|nr:carboxypeptidase-like regulatory domain-containing protein [Terriglobia bacterium]
MTKRSWRRWAVLSLAASVAIPCALQAVQSEAPPSEPITLTVVVTDAQTSKPIGQARLTLTFRRPKEGQFSRAHTLSFSAKTDAQGRYRFPYIPSGTVTLMVTDEHHQTFGKQFAVDKHHSTLEVKLKPPQPLL